MHSWRDALREGVVAGTAASLASAAALALAGRREDGRAAAPLNAVSHWFFGRKAFRKDGPSARHTLTGYAVHHGASVFWATLHSRAWGMRQANKQPLRALAGGAAASALACFVDYRLTPQRLTPGFEQRLSRPALAAVYLCFGLGLAAGSMALRRRSAPSGPTGEAPRRRPRPAR